MILGCVLTLGAEVAAVMMGVQAVRDAFDGLSSRRGSSSPSAPSESRRDDTRRSPARREAESQDFTPADNSLSAMREKARQLGIELPRHGVGPVRQFLTEGEEDGKVTRRLVYFEWPDGTEELRGHTYQRTRITTVEPGGQPWVEFRYRRRVGDRHFGIEKEHLDFGEFLVRPNNLQVGQRWRSRDATEQKSCEVIAAKSLEAVGRRHDHCLEIRCSTETKVPEGDIFKGTALTHHCPDVGMVKDVLEASNGSVTVEVSSVLVGFAMNGAAGI